MHTHHLAAVEESVREELAGTHGSGLSLSGIENPIASKPQSQTEEAWKEHENKSEMKKKGEKRKQHEENRKEGGCRGETGLAHT